ncbi:hypothetical protein [Subtercola sp. YIM 133946]|uniref:hypothetical protein n=1 Tax=Subtercola sp. YIM 133946 TaxID=3118909 RepID=UPI002F952905
MLRLTATQRGAYVLDLRSGKLWYVDGAAGELREVTTLDRGSVIRCQPGVTLGDDLVLPIAPSRPRQGTAVVLYSRAGKAQQLAQLDAGTQRVSLAVSGGKLFGTARNSVYALTDDGVNEVARLRPHSYPTLAASGTQWLFAANPGRDTVTRIGLAAAGAREIEHEYAELPHASNPMHLAVDGNGVVFTANAFSGTVSAIRPDRSIQTFSLPPAVSAFSSGPAPSTPTKIVIGADNTVYALAGWVYELAERDTLVRRVSADSGLRFVDIAASPSGPVFATDDEGRVLRLGR